MGAANKWEADGRAAKVSKLVSTIDAYLTGAEIHPFGEGAFPAVAGLKPEAWLKAAREAGCHPPSPTTIAAVVAVYRARPEHVTAVRRATGV